MEPCDGGGWSTEPMDVQCERCKTEYEFDDALVSGRGTTVRCTNCGHQFKVRRDARDDAEDDVWVVTRADGRQVSFGTLRELQRAILAKQVSRADVLERRGSPPRQLGSIAELEPFFQGRTSSRPPPAAEAPDRGPGATFPKRSAVWQGEGAAPNASLTPIPAVVPARRTNSYGTPAEQPRRKMDTLRPPATGTAAPPPAAPVQIHPQPIVTAAPQGGASAPVVPPPTDSEPVTQRPQLTPVALPPAVEMSSPLPPPTRALRRTLPGAEHDGSSMRPSIPSEAAYFIPRGRRVGGWVVALVLMLAVGVVGWVVVKPYLVARNSGAAAAQIDPRAKAFVSDGERALADGNLDLAKENFDKASALAEGDAHVLLDQARLACALADIPWLKVRLLAPDAADETRATRAQLDERVAKARRAADDALAVAPSDIATMRAKIDALRLSGERDAARAYVSKVISQASQPETAYVLAALDLAEPEPLWTTVIDRLRFAAAGEGSAGRARAALVYALAKSGDTTGASAELAKLDALQRPYPVLSSLHAFMERMTKSGPDAGVGAKAAASGVAPAVATGAAPPPALGGAGAPAVAAPPGGGGGGGGEGLQAAAQAVRKGDWERARQIYDALVTRNPHDSEALCGLGDVARAEGDSSGAIAAYKHVIAINPSYLPALLGLADTQWATGDRATATRGYRDIADRFPEGTYPAYVKQRVEGPAPAAAGSGVSGAKGATAPGAAGE